MSMNLKFLRGRTVDGRDFSVRVDRIEAVSDMHGGVTSRIVSFTGEIWQVAMTEDEVMASLRRLIEGGRT